MKKVSLYIVVLLSITIGLNSCEILEAVCGMADYAVKYMDNCDRNTYDNWRASNPDADASEFKGYQFGNDNEMKGWFTALNAASAGEGGLGLVGVKVLGNVVGSVGGLDMSTFNQVMDNSMNDLIADKHASSDRKMNIIGALAHTAEQVGYLIEDKIEGRRNEDYLQSELDRVNDPESPFYDPYFYCKYEIVTTREGAYASIQTIKERGWNSQTFEELQQVAQEKMQCIHEVDSMLAEERFREYMESVYGVSMSYEEYSRLPDDQKPNIENYVFPSHKTAEEVINETTPIDELTNEVIDNNTESNHDEQSVVKLNDFELIESIKTSDYRFKSYALTEENKAELDKVAEILLRNPDLEIELLGHSCDIGETEAKYIIGIQRAKAAKQYLVHKGVDAKHIYVHSYADKKPLVPNNSSQNRARNRRVEIKIIK